MRKPHRGRGRRFSLSGTGKWVLLLLIPLSVLSFEVCVRSRTYQNDYEMNEISKRLKDLSQQLDAFEDERARLEALDRIELAAPALGLVAPKPGQIEIICCVESDEPPTEGPASYVVAARTAPSCYHEMK